MTITSESLFERIDPDGNLDLNIDVCKYFTIREFNSNFSSDKNSYMLLNQNLQSFNAKQAVFEAFLDSLCTPLNALVLTETWTEANTLELCNIDNFDPVHTHRLRPLGHHGAIGGGVSIFANSSIYGILKIDELSFCNEFIEVCVARLFRLNNNEQEHYIVGVYRPRHDADHNFLISLQRILTHDLLKNKIVILAGDLNIDLLKLNENYVYQYLSMLKSLNFFQVINKATRFPSGVNSTQNPSCLDHIFINKFIQCTGPIFIVDISDHCCSALYFELETATQSSNKKHKISFRPFTEVNMRKLDDKLAQTDWTFITDVEDVNAQFTAFQNYINYTYCDCFPLMTKFISNKRKKKPWITESTMEKIKNKSAYYKQFSFGIISREVYNRLKNRLNKEIMQDKKAYYKNLFSSSTKNMKKSWKTLHSLLGTNNSKSCTDKIFSSAKNDSDKVQIVNKFNDFFANIGNILADQLPITASSPLFPSDHVQQSFFIFPPSIDEISKIIMSLKLTSTPSDVMPVKIFKKFSHILVFPITRMIENSIQNGVFPNDLKIARISPKHKEDSYSEPSNFRPISSLSYLSKVYEKFFSLRIIKFFSKYSVIAPNQYGFQNGRSTTDALINLTEQMYSAIDNNSFFIAAIIDIRKAFDCVNHEILKAKLERYGIRGMPLKWLDSYLTDRKCYVELGSHKSKMNTFNVGVPQGSILGPTLFLIYINNLPKISDILKTQLFADDTIVSSSGINIDSLIETTNTELSKLQDWTEANKLTIHAGKTNLLLVSKRRASTSSNIIFMDRTILPVNNCKYLGIYLDDRLTFKDHINYIISKISRHTGILYKIKDNLPTKTRIDYYYAYIYPYLSYNTIIWGSADTTHIQPLINQQKRAIRTIANAGFRDHTNPLFKQFKLLKLQDIHKFQLGTFMFHARQRGEYATQSRYQTRGLNRVLSDYHRLSTTQRAVSYTAPTFWNSLPEYLRCLNSYNVFRKSLKNFLVNQY